MLKVKFTRIRNVVVAEILEQGVEIKRGEFHISDGTYSIRSFGDPELYEYALHIGGENPIWDKRICAYSYYLRSEAKEAIEAFTALIKQHNKSCKYVDLENNTGITIAGNDIEITIAE